MPSCRKCLTGRSGDKIGDKCRTEGCDGIIEEDLRIQDVTDELPEPMTCGRRADNGMDDPNSPFVHAGRNLDRWLRHKSNGNRVCNYCRSLHPEDFFALVKASGQASISVPYLSVPEIEPSTKTYKIYVHQPGVRNADEGGIKFYVHHFPKNSEGMPEVSLEQREDLAKAIKNSRSRFLVYLDGVTPV